MEDNRKEAIKKISIFLAAMAILGGGYGFYYNSHLKYKIETENAYINGEQSTINSQLFGTVVAIYKKEMDSVKEGELLAEIDNLDYLVALEGARGALGKAVRDFSSLKSSSSISSNNLNLKELDVKKLQNDYTRDLEGYRAGVVSKQQLDATEHLLSSSKVALSVAKEQLLTSNSQIKTKDIYSHPIVQVAISNYKKAKINLDRTKIYATTSGIIGKKMVSLGQQVATNQQLFLINNLDSIWVDANFKETQLKELKINNRVEIESDLNGLTYSGKVVGISSGTGSSMSLLPAQNATGNWIKVVQRVPVKISIDRESLASNGTLPIGSSVLVTIDNRELAADTSSLTSTSESSNKSQEYLKEIENEIDKIISENL